MKAIELRLSESSLINGVAMKSIAVVIVTYNSEQFFSHCLTALEKQSRQPDHVVIVDSGSKSTEYLKSTDLSTIKCAVVLKSNVGFSVGCNVGWELSRDYDFVLFLNPDAFLTPDFLERALQFMEEDANKKVGMLTGTLLGYDIDLNRPTGLVDSTGVIQTWYGQSIDRDQGKPISVLDRYPQPNSIPAICGAVLLARRTALYVIAKEDVLFDPDYFMYKEDIDLSWRAVRAGWTLIHHPGLTAYHCRGWKGRHAASRKMRMLSARNDIKLFVRFRSPYLMYALVKYGLVWTFDI
jgi:N-acetylglucosaminyl-diphospho-decaprenol L-rhamnosyltransferase